MSSSTDFFRHLRASPSASIAQPEVFLISPLAGMSLANFKGQVLLAVSICFSIVLTINTANPGRWLLISPFVWFGLRYTLPLIIWLIRCLCSRQCRADLFYSGFSPLRGAFYLYILWILPVGIIDRVGPRFGPVVFAIPVALALISYRWMANRAAAPVVIA